MAKHVAPQEHWAKWGSNVQLKPPKGQSAKDFSRTQLKSNPNQYFYRRATRTARRSHCSALRMCRQLVRDADSSGGRFGWRADRVLCTARCRHNEPGEDEWHGEWSEEEIQSFVEACKPAPCADSAINSVNSRRLHAAVC